jgi:putative intracellular protease/amidase
MADKKETAQDPRLDQDGIAIHEYEKIVLVVLPSEGFGEGALRSVRSTLEAAGVETRCVSPNRDEAVKGRLQDEFLVDEALAGQKMSDYAGIFLAAGDTEELTPNGDLLRLLGEANSMGKWIATFGSGLSALAKADILRGKKVTGSIACRDLVSQAGAKYTGRPLEVADNVITALDECAGLRLGRAFAEMMREPK